jgi:hypothetical protein
MMHVTKGLFLFSTRACLFMLAHVIFYYGPARGSSELQLLNSIAITSACLLAITVAWLAWEVGKKVCCISPFDLVQQNCASDRDNEELSDNDDDTTTILQRADAADNNNNTREEEEEEHPVVHLSRVTTRRLHVTPWILWYYAHAAGVSVFIMAYSIAALSSLPSVSVIAAISACTVLGGGDGDSALLELAAWPFCMIVALSLFCADLMLEVGLDAWVQAFAGNMWMGCVMPAGACVFLFRVIRRVRCARLTPYEMISFTLPSLAMLSASFLSIYMPWASLAASAGVQNTTSSSLESLTLLYSYYFNSSHYAASHSADNNNNNNSGSLVLGSSSSTLGDQVATYMRDHPLFFFHDNRSQNQNYYTNYDTADDGSTSMLASITLSLLCPPVLFALLIIFLSSFTALSDHSTKSNASAFALSNIMRRFFFTLSTNKLVRVFSLLFVLGAAAVVIVARAVRELDDNDEEQQQQGSSNDTNNMSTFQPATSSENSMVETPAT